MTRAVRDRILKDANGDISDHLRNHIHLTNCIHLKNHMHKHSPIMAERSLMRDLIVLQRSRSLRDPSASPPSWHSPSVVDLLSKKGDKDTVREERRSVGVERQRAGRRLSISSPPSNFETSKVAPGEASGVNEAVRAISDLSSKSGARDSRRIRREESSRRSNKTDPLGEIKEPEQEQDGNGLPPDTISGNSALKDRKSKKQKGKQTQGVQMKTPPEQLHDLPMDSYDVASSNVHPRGRHVRPEKTGEEPEVSIRGYPSGLNRAKRRKFRAARSRVAPPSRELGAQNELSVASNSFAQGSVCPKYGMEEEENEFDGQNVTRAPRNGCGIPFNWSRIHHRGKSFLDIAGRTFSCGLSDSRLRKGGAGSHGRNAPELPVESDQSNSSSKSNAEALPLLIEASGSQGSTENAGWVNDYSGELGIFADSLLKRNIDSDLASEARSGDQLKLGRGRHQNITQKYMPRTFTDIVGQNLVSQVLSNAVMKRKVRLLYVFYGPHGTGKTSCARIFARALNCQSLEQPKPCGFCNSCISHDMGKSSNIREIGPVSNFDFQGIMDLLDNMVISQLPSQYRVFIFDDCDTLSPDCWSAISKVIDRVPRRVVFILVSSSLDILPHIIMSRCQKFFFPKLKDSDIIHTLQWISSIEDIEIEKEALKLIASRSDGSLRDAEMTLEQLSLLGQKISVPLVQELVGLISDEKLVDLLDLALSADTVNTVKSLRAIMETGAEPLALISQLATVITDILAGCYDFSKERHRRKFFRRQPYCSQVEEQLNIYLSSETDRMYVCNLVSKEDMEKLRQALKTLSEAEKQLRMSNDKLTWLTAALLQLAPDQQYIFPISSADTSSPHSPLPLNDVAGRNMSRRGGELVELRNDSRGLSENARLGNLHAGNLDDFETGTTNGINLDRKRHSVAGMAPQQTSTASSDFIRVTGRQSFVNNSKGVEEIWLEVLEKIRVSSLKEFLYQEGKLTSVSFGAAPTAQLMFSSHMNKSKAEKFREHILQAFEYVLGSPVTIEISCEVKKDPKAGFQGLLVLPSSGEGPSHMVMDPKSISGNRMHRAGSDDINKRLMRDRDAGFGSQAQPLHPGSLEAGRHEIVEIPASPRETNGNEHADNIESSRRGSRVADATAYRKTSFASSSGRRKLGELSQSQSIVRSKVSLAHVIQRAEGCSQRNGWSKNKAVSFAEKLEQENLRLEPRSRSLLCWKASRVTRRKLSRLKIRTRRPHTLLKLVSCGKCLSSKSPR